MLSATLISLLFSCGAPNQTAGPTPASETGARVHTQDIDPVRTHGSVSPSSEGIATSGSQGHSGTNPEEGKFREPNTHNRRSWEDTYGSPFDPNDRVDLYDGGGESKYGQSGSTNPIQQQRRVGREKDESN